MKRILFLLLLLLMMLAFSGCTVFDDSMDSSVKVRVIVEESGHFISEINAVTVSPGSNAVLAVRPDRNYTVTGTDYNGEYALTQADGLTRLELKNVCYPTRVALTLAHDGRTIEYHANGGRALTQDGTVVSVAYDVSVHKRPNVSVGTDLFTRDGHTLVSWNTAPDGSGTAVGLGSRMTVEDSAVLYAQWVPWTDADWFEWRVLDGFAVITGYTGNENPLVIPETLNGCTVISIDAYALADCPAETVILPKTLQRIEQNAFCGADLRELWLFDNIDYFSDSSFSDCTNFSTLHISAIEAPYGYAFRRESVYADKLDLLISTMGQKRILFYGGCSIWYNLIGSLAQEMFGDDFTIINMGLNGVSSSLFQMELLLAFMTEKDILFHTPEISSTQQLLITTKLSDFDDKLWCAMEYNYDLVSLLDIRCFDSGFFTSLRLYWDKKKPGGRYTDDYRDSRGNAFLEETGSIPFIRTCSEDTLADKVELDLAYLRDLTRLSREYGAFMEKGVKIYVSYAVIDIDQVPAEQQDNLESIGSLFRETFSAMPGVTVVGRIEDFICHDSDCYDTVYHLLTEPAMRCTENWLRGLKEVMTADGLL